MNLLITGATRGLGYEMAVVALERGHSVWAGTRTDDKSDKMLRLTEKYGDRISWVRLDARNEDGIAAVASAMKREGKTLGAIVNNAAILVGRNTPIENLNMEDVEKSFEVNLYGPMKVIKHFLPLLTEPNASIINVSSEAGSITNAYPGDYPYGLSKAALNMLSMQLQAYVRNRGIRVLSVHPGWMKTDMGGDKAPREPRESACGIIDLIERKPTPEYKYNFVDYAGNEMPI